MDQTFSILCTELKKQDLLTVEALKKQICSAGINPKASCRSLEFTYDWKAFISPLLADPQMSHHTRYNSFVIINEKGKAILR